MGEVDLSKLLIVTDNGPCAECTAGYHHGCTVWDRRCNCKGEADREAAVRWAIAALGSAQNLAHKPSVPGVP